MPSKVGFVAIIGRPNAGKSTLVNQLVGQKVAIVTPRPQTTRNRIQGVVNRPGAQIVLIDTPGIHKPESQLGRQMMEEVRQALEGIDVLVLLVDASEEFGKGDRIALDMASKFSGSVILALNKIDRMAKLHLLPKIKFYTGQHNFAAVVPISAMTGEGLPALLSEIEARLPEGEPYFPPEQYTDQPERFLAAEIVREKAILALRQELPHAIAVLVDSYEEGERLLRIHATIYVERDGQKGIVIGKGGAMLKKIGTDARIELERLLGGKVFLELHVKVQPDWRDQRGMVKQLDWRRQLEQLGGEESE